MSRENAERLLAIEKRYNEEMARLARDVFAGLDKLKAEYNEQAKRAVSLASIGLCSGLARIQHEYVRAVASANEFYAGEYEAYCMELAEVAVKAIAKSRREATGG